MHGLQLECRAQDLVQFFFGQLFPSSFHASRFQYDRVPQGHGAGFCQVEQGIADTEKHGLLLPCFQFAEFFCQHLLVVQVKAAFRVRALGNQSFHHANQR